MPKETKATKRETLKSLRAEIEQHRASKFAAIEHFTQRVALKDFELREARAAIADAHATIAKLGRQFAVFANSLSLIETLASESCARAEHFEKALTGQNCAGPVGRG